jgi:hypothetical protein
MRRSACAVLRGCSGNPCKIGCIRDRRVLHAGEIRRSVTLLAPYIAPTSAALVSAMSAKKTRAKSIAPTRLTTALGTSVQFNERRTRFRAPASSARGAHVVGKI